MVSNDTEGFNSRNWKVFMELKKIKYIGDLMRAVPVEWLGSSLVTEMTRVEFIIQFV